MKKIFITLFSFIYLLLIGSPISSNIVYANDIVYTDVLSDLQKDENFDISNYPKVANNYSIDVIQIAESSDDELFIYTYNPSTKRKATHIAISPILSTNGSNNAIWVQYELTYINTYDTLDKYVVKNFIIKNDLIRYYDISRISTEVLNGIDENETNGNTLNYVSFEVGKQWTISTDSSGNVIINREDTDTIVVTDKYVGRLRYKDGFFLADDSVDSHFIVFKTDKNIDQLHEADVTYSYYYQHTYGYKLAIDDNSTQINSVELDNPEELEYSYYTSSIVDGAYFEDISVNIYHTETNTKQKTLSEDEIVSGGGQVFVDEYEYARIQSVEKFLAVENIDGEFTDKLIGELENKEWVLRFLETSYIDNSTWTTAKETIDIYEGIVEEVSILRLKFTNDGVVYNLGVVDNLTSGSTEPDNKENEPPDTCDWFCDLKKKWDEFMKNVEKAVQVICFILVFVLIYVILSNITKIKNTIQLSKLTKNNNKNKK